MDWNNYFLDIATVVSTKSKDPNTKVGAVLVSEDNRIISTGYNGMPAGIEEKPEMWERPMKYDYVLHAELNAIVYANKPGYKIYSTMFPCKECAKVIAAAGIKEVYYLKNDYENEITKEIFRKCKIKFTQFHPVSSLPS